MVPKPMSGIPINWRWWTFHVLCTSVKVKVIDRVDCIKALMVLLLWMMMLWVLLLWLLLLLGLLLFVVAVVVVDAEDVVRDDEVLLLVLGGWQCRC